MQIALHVVHCLQFAAWVEQAADDDVTEHAVSDGTIANAVVECTKHQFWTCHLYLGVVQAVDETVYNVLLFIHVWQGWPSHLL